MTDEGAEARGLRVVAELRALGMTDEEILAGEPVDVSAEEVFAWIDGRAPCPVGDDGRLRR